MKVVFSPSCYLHDPGTEILSGEIIPYLESPDRLRLVEDWLRKRSQASEGAGGEGFEFVEAGDDGFEPIFRCHERDYVAYLMGAFEEWERQGLKGNVMPDTFPHSSLRSGVAGHVNANELSVIGKAGYYSFDLSCAIAQETWKAIYASAQCAITGANILYQSSTTTPSPSSPKLASIPSAFAMTRPPGHHATPNLCGGYCYINNVAVAAKHLQYLSRSSALRGESSDSVVILDIDYHHGNGSQQMFYDDPNVLYVSLHAEGDYPYFTGFASERGSPVALGSNINIPLKTGETSTEDGQLRSWTGDKEYCDALEGVLKNIDDWLRRRTKEGVEGRSWLIVSLGVDTYKDDPICQFGLTTPCYTRIGQLIASLRLPTLFCFEGGYHLETIADNVGGVLSGFASGVSAG